MSWLQERIFFDDRKLPWKENKLMEDELFQFLPSAVVEYQRKSCAEDFGNEDSLSGRFVCRSEEDERGFGCSFEGALFFVYIIYFC